MKRRYDLVIIGMGSGGIVAAELAAEIGLRVAAVERDRIGGDCLWTGCVPSKALLASARAAHAMRSADRLGLPPVVPEIDTSAVWRRVKAVQQEIADADDNPERFESLGVEMIFGMARLAGPHAVEVDGRTLDTRFVLVATGSRPAVPDIPGLATAGFLTNESVFELERAPESVVVLGGGPVGVELGQALVRLGSQATLLQRGPRLLARDDPELVERITRILRTDGVDVRLDDEPTRVSVEGGRKMVHSRSGRHEADEILVATGRAPNVEGLGLPELGVELGPGGVRVDHRMRTSVRSIYATGDVAGRFHFTHAAAYETAIAVRNMFFPGWSRAPRLVPWCTFTQPELAHVGVTEAQALARFGAGRVRVHRIDLSQSDRARADATTEGALAVVTASRRVVGAHLLAPSAGEMIHELALLVRDRKKLLDLSSLVHVYPTISTSLNLLVAEEAFALVRRYGWVARRGRRCS